MTAGRASGPDLKRLGQTALPEPSGRAGDVEEGPPGQSAVTEGGCHSQSPSFTAGRSKGEKDQPLSSLLPFSFWYLPLPSQRHRQPLEVPLLGLREGQREFCKLQGG